MNPFEPLRDIITEQLASGSTYKELATALNVTGTPAMKGGEWTEYGAYNAARRLRLASTRPCKAQPRSSMTARAESTRRAAGAAQRAVEAGVVSVDDLQRGSIGAIATRIGVSDWTWRQYRNPALVAMGLIPALRL